LALRFRPAIEITLTAAPLTSKVQWFPFRTVVRIFLGLVTELPSCEVSLGLVTAIASTVRVNTETVYSGRREAGVVMTSTGNVWILASGLSDRATLDRRYCPPNVVAANAQ
jgi:hypothetical protein